MAQRGSELKFSIQICILMLNFHCVTPAALTEKFLVQLSKYLPRLLFSNQKLIYLSLLPSSMIPASWQRSWHVQILQRWYHNFNMNFESCSFRQIKKIACGSSRNLSQMVKVDECQDTITTQLETCHLSKSGLSEAELILGTLCNRTVEGRRRQNGKISLCDQRNNLIRQHIYVISGLRLPSSCLSRRENKLFEVVRKT